MPQIPTPELIQSIVAAIENGNSSTSLTSPPARNPRQFIIQSPQGVLDVWIYIWTLTHGGGTARPRDEYRIQMTSVTPPLERNPRGYTLLLGYEPNTGCFAGFDLAKHTTFSAGSPSIQIPFPVVHDALQHGFSFHTKGNDEIVIGFRPDQLIAYILNADILHRLGADAEMVDLLTRASSQEPIEDVELSHVTQERQRVVATVERLSRDAGFRRKVTTAYDHRCAVTRIQLQLVDAAHILPVGDKESIDEVANGLCLSPTYHRAFDRGLIYLDEHLIMRINPQKEEQLRQRGVHGGLQEFSSYLNRLIHLPADRRQWPDLRFVRAGNILRRIPNKA